MKLTGIIAEYNPFHSGHEFHIKKAKELTGSDCCVVVMSGDFVQRGEPAVYSKYLRTRMALCCGADLVVELPSAFAVSSAEDFAACGVSLLTSLGAVDTICFGSEDGQVQPLLTAASLLAEESPVFSGLLNQGLKQGLSWPQARNHALIRMAGTMPDFPLQPESLDRLLGSPNNLLGIEYCKAIIRSSSHLKPITVKRMGQGYHDRELNQGQASASALRRLMTENIRTPDHLPDPASSLSSHVPRSILPMYGAEPAVTANDLSGLLNYTLLTMASQDIDFAGYADVSKEMASRLRTRLLEYENWEGRIRQLKTRQYTYTRISRALLHILLAMTDQDMAQYKSAGYAPYARILGFKKDNAKLLSMIKKQSSIPLITKTADAPRILTGTALSMLNKDIHATHIRQSILAHAYGYRCRNEYTQPVCIL